MNDADLAVADLESLRTAELQRLAYIRQADYASAKEVHLVMGRNVPKLLDFIESQAKQIKELERSDKALRHMISQIETAVGIYIGSPVAKPVQAICGILQSYQVAAAEEQHDA